LSVVLADSGVRWFPYPSQAKLLGHTDDMMHAMSSLVKHLDRPQGVSKEVQTDLQLLSPRGPLTLPSTQMHLRPSHSRRLVHTNSGGVVVSTDADGGSGAVISGSCGAAGAAGAGGGGGGGSGGGGGGGGGGIAASGSGSRSRVASWGDSSEAEPHRRSVVLSAFVTAAPVPKLLSSYSRPRYFVHFAGQLATAQRRSDRVLAAKEMLDTMLAVLAEKYRADAICDTRQVAHAPLPQFVFEFFFVLHGSKSVAQSAVFTLLQSMHRHRRWCRHARYIAFLKLLGMQDTCRCGDVPVANGVCSCGAARQMSLPALDAACAVAAKLLEVSCLCAAPCAVCGVRLHRACCRGCREMCECRGCVCCC
jgi:hypothetical protein